MGKSFEPLLTYALWVQALLDPRLSSMLDRTAADISLYNALLYCDAVAIVAGARVHEQLHHLVKGRHLGY